MSKWFDHSNKKRKDSLKTLAELAVLCTYADSQAILEHIFPYCASEYKETKEQGQQRNFMDQ